MSDTPAPKIYGALARVMAEVGHVGKERKNQQQGYTFRGIDDVMAAVQQVLAKHGVVVVPQVIERERDEGTTKSGGKMTHVRFLVDHHFFAEDGSSVVARTVGEAMDTADKSSNKAMSAALKYALVETLMIPTYEADRDTEEETPEMHRAQPAQQPQRQPPPRPPVQGQAAANPLANATPEDLRAEIGLAKTVDDIKKLSQVIGKGHALREELNDRYKAITAQRAA
jgi:hypothetical protein